MAASARQDRSEGGSPGLWFWVLPVAYTVHIAEEFFVGSGFYTWVGRFVPFSAPSFLGVNFVIILLVAVAVRLAITRVWGGFLIVAVLTHFALHGLLVHPLFTAWAGQVSPGLVTGVVVLLPLTALGFAWAQRALPRRAVLRGVATGLLLFASQDLWRVLFNAVLGSQPPNPC